MQPENTQPEIILYEYAPSRSKQVRWTLLELELEFESKEGREYLHSEELKRVSPMGKVPAVLIDGEPLFESAAICTCLADLVPEKALIAAAGTRERALHLQWTSFALTEMEAYLWSNARNTFVLPKDKRITALFEQNNQAVQTAARVLEAHLTDNKYLISNQFSIADILVGFTLGWAKGFSLLDSSPRLLAYLERLQERPNCPL